eukprot:2125662-Pyramimonas_sp.AAC.1
MLLRIVVVTEALRPSPVPPHESLHLEHALLRRPPLPRAPVHQCIEPLLVLIIQLVVASADIIDPPR